MKDEDCDMAMDDDGQDETAYLEQRAAWHRDRASEAREDSTRALHEKFSRMYDARIQSRTSTFDL
ncbi:hypothetical protein ACFSGX_13010 [Sphingomonas arantia]|uniref:Uncharacterized protein n=1 Tax=Sphingomonas arantia TaxID=1460676 RepID=A0ABW4TYV8_9SPHN